MNVKKYAPVSEQQGIVLVVALIMLLAVTLIVVSASNLVQTNLRVVSNMESRQVARAAALAAIEEAISSARFVTSPQAMFIRTPCDDGANNQMCYDLNGDGQFDVVVQMQEPTCVSVRPRANSSLDVFGDAAQASCFLPPAVYSMCADSIWDFQATAIDAVTGAEITLRQGVSVLTTLNNIDTVCPI